MNIRGDLEIASGILTKKEAVVRQNEYTQDKIDEVKKEYFEKGWGEYEKSHQKILEQEKEDSIVSLLNKIETDLLNIYQTLEKDYDSLAKDCANLSYEIASKLAGKLTNKFPNDILLGFLEENLPLLAHARSVKVRVNPKNYDGIKAYMEDINKNLPMKVDLIEDTRINVGGCEVDWENGSIKKDTERLRNDLESIFENNL